MESLEREAVTRPRYAVLRVGRLETGGHLRRDFLAASISVTIRAVAISRSTGSYRATVHAKMRVAHAPEIRVLFRALLHDVADLQRARLSPSTISGSARFREDTL